MREVGLAKVASSKVFDVTRFAVGYMVEGSVKKAGLPTNTAGQACENRGKRIGCESTHLLIVFE